MKTLEIKNKDLEPIWDKVREQVSAQVRDQNNQNNFDMYQIIQYYNWYHVYGQVQLQVQRRIYWIWIYREVRDKINENIENKK